MNMDQPQSGLAIYVLGAPELYLHGKPLAGLPAKTQALLIYLALTRQPHPRVTLANLLWGELPEKSARANLRKAIQQLCTTLPDHFQSERQSVALRAAHTIWIDAVAFTEQIAEAQETNAAQPLDEALQLYRADFLFSFFVRNAPDFETWQLAQREHLREQLVGALETLAQQWAEQHELARAVAVTRRLLRLEPWRETAHRQLMELLARNGERSAALAHFDVCREQLRRELDVDLAAETIALHEQIRADEFNLSPERPPLVIPMAQLRHNLPSPTTPLLGRAEEIAQLLQLFADSSRRLVSIVAPGGMGKSHLAVTVATELLPLFADGVYFVALAPLSDVENMTSTMAAAVGYTFQNDGRTPKQQLLDYLRAKELLLLLDNAEHLLAGVGLFTEILQTASKVRLLVTSRERLRLHSETVFPLARLALSGKDDAEGAAADLFVQTAQRVRPAFEPTATDWPAIHQICQFVGGMPLGLILAASWVELLSPVEIAVEIGRSLDFLAVELNDMPERHHSLRAVFETTWQRLSAEERIVFQKLAVFRGGFTREAAECVADASLATLTALKHKALIQTQPNGRFQIHELLRQFALEKLHATGEFAEIEKRYKAYITAQSAEELYRLSRRRVFRQENLTYSTTKADNKLTANPTPKEPAFRVLMLCAEYPPYGAGGVSKHVAEILPALGKATVADKPILLDLVTPCFARENPVEAISPTVTVYRVFVTTPDDVSDGKVTAHNAALIEQANSLLRRHDYTLLHIHDVAVGAAGLALKHQWQLPLLVTIHGTVKGRMPQPLPDEYNQVEQLERQVCEQADHIVVTSSFMCQEVYEGLGVALTKISVIPNGISTKIASDQPFAWLHALRQQYAPHGEKLLLFVGPTVYEKGLLTLIRTMPEIMNHHPNVHLLVASRHGAKLLPLARALYVEEVIKFLGFISDEHRDGLYQIVDAVIIPSLYEPFGFVALEAMALGCPVIASNVGGLGEVIQNQHNGLSIVPNSPESIIEAVNQLFNNSAATQQRRLNALHDIDTNYRWDKIAAQIAGLYASLIGTQRQELWVGWEAGGDMVQEQHRA